MTIRQHIKRQAKQLLVALPMSMVLATCFMVFHWPEWALFLGVVVGGFITAAVAIWKGWDR